MFERHSPSWRAQNLARVRRKQAAGDRRRADLQHEDNLQVVAALNNLANQIEINRVDALTSERKRSCRELSTIAVILIGTVVAVIGLWVSHGDTRRALKQARYDTGIQHADTSRAIEVAAEANKTAHRQADITSDTEGRQLRAYLSVRAEPHLELSDDGRASADLTITDTGQTPAYHVKWASEFLIDTDYQSHGMYRPCEQMWFMNVEEGNLGILGRSITKPVNGGISNHKEWIGATKNRNGMVVYLIGKVCYEDNFRAVHWTTFCIVWNGTGGGRGNAEYCDKGGNDADRDDPKVQATSTSR